MDRKIEFIRYIPNVTDTEFNKTSPKMVELRCYCGELFIRNKYQYKHGKITSCGCAFKEYRKKQPPPNKKHGALSGKQIPSLYSVWNGIKQRCLNKNNKAYKYYGGRGISVCQEWIDDFEAFNTWSINNGWKPKLHLDRKENDGDYCPNNCRFVTPKVNQNNRRTNLDLFKYNEEVKTLSEWAKHLKISYGVLYRRIFYLHLPIDVAFKKDYNKHSYVKSHELAYEIKDNLDGRKNRWLLKKINELGIKMDDSKLSNKMLGKEYFEEKEVLAIDKSLNTNLFNKYCKK